MSDATGTEQIQEEDDFIPDRELCRELLASISSIDTRLSELDIIFNSNPLDKERRKFLTDRKIALINTRFMLLHTFWDFAGTTPQEYGSVNNPFRGIDTSYEQMKRHFRRNNDKQNSDTKV